MCVVVIINNVQIMISAPAAVVVSSGFLWRLKRSRTLASKHAYIVIRTCYPTHVYILVQWWRQRQLASA